MTLLMVSHKYQKRLLSRGCTASLAQKGVKRIKLELNCGYQKALGTSLVLQLQKAYKFIRPTNTVYTLNKSCLHDRKNH